MQDLEVVSDSELLVKQMRGEYKVKNRALQALFLDASRLARRIHRVTYTAVRREHNELATGSSTRRSTEPRPDRRVAPWVVMSVTSPDVSGPPRGTCLKGASEPRL